MTPDQATVAQVIDRLIGTWNRNQMDQMDLLWDQDDPAPFYLAEEESTPATTWDEVRDYWRRTLALNEKIAVEISRLHVKIAGDETAFAFYQLYWQIKLSRYPRALAGDTRVMVGLRRKDGNWLIHTYLEGALSPITYVRELYESRVRPDF